MKKREMVKRVFCLFMVLCMTISIPSLSAKAAGSYTADWQRWSQGASGYASMQYGCRVTAYSKMLAEAGYTGFGNPDGFFEWGKGKGYFRASDTCELTSIGVAPVTYVNSNGGVASLAGRQTLTGNKTTDANMIMNLINQGYYVVLTCNDHSAYVGRAESIRQGTAVILDSWASANVGPSFQYRSYTQYTFKTANYFSITDNSANNNPIGCLDDVQGRTNAVWIRGWAFDLDDISRNLEIHVYIGGPAGSGEGHTVIANDYRNDVNNIYGVGDNHGFDAEISTSLLGNQEVYVYAINIGLGIHQLLGAQTVTIMKANDPQGCVDRIQGGIGLVNVSGWGFDLDDLSKSIEIHVYIGGPAGSGEGHTVIADQYRNDVNNVYGVGDYHGYFSDVPTSLYGSQAVYVYAINIGSGEHILLGSETVMIACNHTYDSYISNQNGTHSRICNNCGETEISDCSYNALVTEPTCKEAGYTAYTCSDCHYSYEADYAERLEHSFTNYVSDNNATTAKDGTKTAYCDYGCGTADTIIDEGSALGTEAPGIENPGNEDLEKPKPDPDNPDNPDNSEQPDTPDDPDNPDAPDKDSTTTYTYKLNDDKTTITITKCTSSNADIVIPSTIDGYTVTEIGDKAFQSVTSMRTVTFPSTLKNIGSYAFADCISLTTVTLPDTLTDLYTYVFKGCTSLKSAKLNAGRINVTEGLFQGCTALSSVTLPDSVQYIREYAFSGCTSLKNLNLPKSLSIVYANAFLNSGITKINYAGTSTNWKNIIISAIGNAKFLNTAVIGSDGKTFSANKSKWNTDSPAPVKKPTVSKVKSFKAMAAKKKLKLSWKKLSGAAGYQIQISTKKNFKGAKTISISKSKNAYTKNSLKAKKKYYIRIRAYKTYKDVNKKTQKVYGKWTTLNKKTK